MCNLMVNTFQSLFIVHVENKKKGVCAGGGTIFSKICFCCGHSVPMLISVVCDGYVRHMLKYQLQEY